MSRGYAKHWLVLGPIVLGIGVGLLLNAIGLMPKPDLRVRWTIPVKQAAEYVPPATQKSGDEVVFIYIGSSTCQWSNVAGLPDRIKQLKRDLFAQAQASGLAFASIGVARDGVAADGMDYLQRFGSFDEVMSGRGWVNSGVQQYMFGAMPGPAITPQVVVVRRTLRYQAGLVVVQSDSVLARMAGVGEIMEWSGRLSNLDAVLEPAGVP